MPDEIAIVNKKYITAFGGKKCSCTICKHSQCEGEVTHFRWVSGKRIWLCAHCAGKYRTLGYRIVEMVF